MNEEFEYTCKKCNEKFNTKALTNVKIENEGLEPGLVINLQECFNSYSFTKVISTKHGQATLNIMDLEVNVKCTKCHHTESYLVSEIHPI